MFAGTFRSLIVPVCVLFFTVCQNSKAQQEAPVKKPSDPVALATIKGWLDSFGDDVYHCKWEYDAERLQGTNFQNGTNKLHIEGEWSFSAKLGSSYTIRCDGIEYAVRELDGDNHRVLSFWPEVSDQGQKYRMNLEGSYNSAAPDFFLGVRGVFYPCVIRWNLLRDQWGNPSVFGLRSSDSDKTVIAIDALREDRTELWTLQTNDGTQAIGEKWSVNDVDRQTYQMYRGAEYDRVYTNVRVNKAWLPAEVTFEKREEEGLLGSKSVVEAARWKIIGQYSVNKDVSKFQRITPPEGTLFYDGLTYKSQRIGTWKRNEKIGNERQGSEFAKELQQLPDTPVASTSHSYPTGRSYGYYAVGAALLAVGLVIGFIKTNGFGLRRQD